MSVKSLSILGATGSIGQNTADVVLSMPDAFDVCVVSAHRDAEGLADLAKRLSAKKAVIADETQLSVLKHALDGSGIEVLGGRAALIEAAGEPVDITMAAIVGMAGLEPLMAAIQGSKAVAIANKEPLVAAGPLVLIAAKDAGCKIMPVDSEHNAIFQVFEEAQRAHVERIILTASGGPFLNWSVEEIARATPEQAVAHPNWDMGAKISVDSATMMNKALEVIEAHYLFDMPADKIEVLVHPQSVVHSMVEYTDGSILSQMGASDMRTPITYALGWPERMKTSGETLDLTSLSSLEFMKPDFERFPALARAYECLNNGLSHCIALNASNEVAVEAFLNKEIGFSDIMEVVDFTLESVDTAEPNDVSAILELDQGFRERALAYIQSGNTKKVAS